jgi:hypothetical protein
MRDILGSGTSPSFAFLCKLSFLNMLSFRRSLFALELLTDTTIMFDAFALGG